MLLIPSYTDKINTIEKINEKGLIPILVPGGITYQKHLDESPSPLYREFGKRAVLSNNWTTFGNLIQEGVLEANTHVLVSSDLPCCFNYTDFWGFVMDSVDPWYVWIINKKWDMKEQLTRLILLLQQVSCFFA